MESLFAASLNGLLQQNLPEADMLRFIRQGSLRDTGDTE
jgi:hypothetical protein